MVEESTTAACPDCGLRIEIETLIVDGDTWRFG